MVARMVGSSKFTLPSLLFFMSRYSGHVPLASPEVAFVLRHSCFGFASGFSNVGNLCVVFTITVDLVDHLSWREFCLVFSTDDVLQADSGCENDGEPCFIEDPAKDGR